MVLEIRKVDSYQILSPTFVDVSRIVGIEKKENLKEVTYKKYNTFRVYFENAEWDIYVEDYDKLLAFWIEYISCSKHLKT